MNSTPPSSSIYVDIYHNVNEIYFERDLLIGRQYTMSDNILIGPYDFTYPFHSMKMHPFQWETYQSERRYIRKERGWINNKSIPCMLKNC